MYKNKLKINLFPKNHFINKITKYYVLLKDIVKCS